MTALRIVNLFVWVVMAIFMARGAWAAAMGRRVHRGDPMRLACFATAVVNAGFTLRWLIAPASEVVWQLLYVLSSAVAVYIVKLGRDYGRGPLL